MEADLQPHRSRYWLTAKAKQAAPATVAAQVAAVCAIYAHAPLLDALGRHVVSTDEMTGIQALECSPDRRCAPVSPSAGTASTSATAPSA